MSHRASVSPVSAASAAAAFGVLFYAVASYAIGVAGLAMLVLCTQGLLPFDPLPRATTPGWAITIDLALLALFGVQHSVMARAPFKRWLRARIPAALERSTYVWASGVALAIVVACWQPVDGVLWDVRGPARWLLSCAALFGWAYLLAATFAIDHWDLFGLRQAWFASRGRAYREVPFTERWMYRYSRHPIQAGVLLGVWSLSTMTLSQAFMSAGLTAYIVVGLAFEERDLIRQWGETYREYRRRVAAFLPWRGVSSSRTAKRAVG